MKFILSMLINASFLCAIGQAALISKEVKEIEIFAVNPKTIESFSSIRANNLIENILEEKKSKEFYHHKIIEPKKIKSFVSKINALTFCSVSEEKNVNVRVVFKIKYNDDSFDHVIFENKKSQRIYALGHICKRNKALYKQMLKTLPLRFRIGIKVKDGDC